MLSHSTFSGSVHLGGPGNTRAFINHVWVRRERRQGRSCEGPVVHQWETVEKLCECHMGQQATVKHAVFEALLVLKDEGEKAALLCNEEQTS